MSRSALSEQVNRLLPGEKWKRVREAILASASYSGQRTNDLRREIDESNRLKTGVLSPGTLDFPTTTSAALDLTVWAINYQIFQPGPVALPVTAPHASFPRPDIFTGDDEGNINYYPGTIDAEGNAQLPIVPEGEVLLRQVTRHPNGDVDVDDSTPSPSEWVSKIATATQTIASWLAFQKMARTDGPPLRVPSISMSGRLYLSDTPAVNDVYSTVEGVGDWSKILTIDISGGQKRYFARMDFSGISANYEKGELWVQFQVDDDGDMVSNKLKVWGEINTAKLKMVRLDTDTYAIFVAHDEAAAFYKTRPLKQFGPSNVYLYHHQDGRNPLPAGDQFEFELYGDLTEIISDIEDLESSLLDLENDLQDNYYTKNESDPEDSTGSVIEFDKPRTYNSLGSPNTNATLTEDNDPFRKVTQVIFHQAASFNPPATWEKSTGSDDYDPAKINVIYVEAFSATYKRYIIDHDE
ncbi:hypothetical protein PBT90_16815 [Algoriphagus halophytocola]|uniref:hypothetical protein n=1 Tax=Algoriphagus halophytocola TaxID=2991499 RepID=UPI0022DD518F|nr:hypothetical protein [Algoriphagus sp. TR-M9]WBL42400.1 hypothetical protein PBT90_16815 [Algoriphagus sp. TR-M9]